jgi:hypothetical protein
MNVAYERGLHELGDGLYAYLQPDGGWGWSNAGLITAGGNSLLVAAPHREFDSSLPAVTPPELFVRMARWSARA